MGVSVRRMSRVILLSLSLWAVPALALPPGRVAVDVNPAPGDQMVGDTSLNCPSLALDSTAAVRFHEYTCQATARHLICARARAGSIAPELLSRLGRGDRLTRPEILNIAGLVVFGQRLALVSTSAGVQQLLNTLRRAATDEQLLVSAPASPNAGYLLFADRAPAGAAAQITIAVPTRIGTSRIPLADTQIYYGSTLAGSPFFGMQTEGRGDGHGILFSQSIGLLGCSASELQRGAAGAKLSGPAVPKAVLIEGRTEVDADRAL